MPILMVTFAHHTSNFVSYVVIELCNVAIDLGRGGQPDSKTTGHAGARV
jgi:hypothetical protein